MKIKNLTLVREIEWIVFLESIKLDKIKQKKVKNLKNYCKVDC